jgi:aminoglycoside 3-N-acetyltransferase
MGGGGMIVRLEDIRTALKQLGLSGLSLCIHASLRLFGEVEGGASTIIDGLHAECCTALVPSFTYRFGVQPPQDQRPARNGWNYNLDVRMPGEDGAIYSAESVEIDRDMGAISAAVVARPGRCRGDHALNSFAAVGPVGNRLISKQQPLDVYAPLKELMEADGFVVLMGVGPQKMTLIHLAEAVAGRRLFRRWAKGPNGQVMLFETGGCSEGFGNLEPILSRHAVTATVGHCQWRAYPARSTCAALVAAIRSQPQITRCADHSCERCVDAVSGGPILTP